MADYSEYVPAPIKSLEHLSDLLTFWNEEVCKKDNGGKVYIHSVVLGTEGPDEGRNLVWYKEADIEPRVPVQLAEFPITLDDEERKKAISEREDAENLHLRSANIVLIGEEAKEKKWVALFDPAPARETGKTSGDTSAVMASSIGTITPDHWLDTARREPIGRGSEFKPRFVVIHYTEGFVARSSVTGWKEKNDGVMAHIVVDRDGRIFQCRPFNQKCAHAGDSRVRDPKTNELVEGLNSHGIGIEIANTGMKGGLHRKLGTGDPYPEGKVIKLDHRNGAKGSSEAHQGKQWEVYPEAQLKSVFELVALLVAKYDLHEITGHDCIAPERKADPGPAFPMVALRERCGFSGLPRVWDKRGSQIPV